MTGPWKAQYKLYVVIITVVYFFFEKLLKRGEALGTVKHPSKLTEYVNQELANSNYYYPASPIEILTLMKH